MLICLVCSCKTRTEQPDRIYKKPVIVANPVLKSLSPEEALQTFYLPEGYKIELVASEPLIGEPVSITWDGDGRMYVAQMRTYMQDADATNENAPWSRISLLEDGNGDGKVDKSSVFIDSMVLPRIVLPLDNRVIIGETYNRNLYTYQDTNGDGIADKKHCCWKIRCATTATSNTRMPTCFGAWITGFMLPTKPSATVLRTTAWYATRFRNPCPASGD
jgi:hypothetical protein